MPVERLSSTDEVMTWADRVWPQDIAVLGILDGAPLVDASGRFALERVRAAVGARLDLTPRLRQRIVVPAPRLGRPVWLDDQAFDLANHVRVDTVAPPGGEAQLLAAVERIRARRLDPGRPLWEMWFLTGLEGGRVGMYVRAHHALADGMAGVSILGGFLDTAPDSPREAPAPWSPSPPPTDAELLADESRRREAAREQRWRAVAHPLAAARSVVAAGPALRELFAEPALPPTSLDRRVGEARAVALVRSDLALMTGAAHACGAKVNDVLLAVIAGGLRRLLQSRGEPVEDAVLRIYVPVSLRHGDYAGARGNQIAQMVVPLPIGLADGGRRLKTIAGETASRKARVRPSVGGLRLSGWTGRLMIGLINRQRVNVESADLPGPPVPLYLAGARVLELFPLLPLIGRVSIGIGGLSYAGQFNIAVVADADSQPDVDVLAAGMREELASLRPKPAVAATAPVGGERPQGAGPTGSCPAGEPAARW